MQKPNRTMLSLNTGVITQPLQGNSKKIKPFLEGPAVIWQIYPWQNRSEKCNA